MSNNQTIGQDDSKEQVEKKIKEKEAVIREHEARLSHLQSSGFQLGNLYLVFQGVILTAIANSTKVFTCNDLWLLISISVLAACPNLVALYFIGQEYLRTIYQRDKCLLHCDQLNAELSTHCNAGSAQIQPSPAAGTPPPGQTPAAGGTPPPGSSAGTTPPGSSAGTPPPGSSAGTPPPGSSAGVPPIVQNSRPPILPVQAPARIRGDYWRKLKRTFFLFGCLASFLGLAVIMVWACWKILCRTAADCKIPSNLSDKCIRLCDESSKCITICSS